MPAGSAPAISDHVYGDVPPAAASVFEYAVETVPSASAAVEIDSGTGAAAIVTENVLVTVCAAVSEACSVTEVVPAAVGVPEMTPVEVLSVRPAGRPPALIAHVYGPVPPAAVAVWLYAVPTCPPASAEVEIESSPSARATVGSAMTSEAKRTTAGSSRPSNLERKRLANS